MMLDAINLNAQAFAADIAFTLNVVLLHAVHGFCLC